ncbi:MAG: GspE/PulE family protein [Planctomycetota bacterium]|jgi:type IV pilus assembly protein PilB
MVKKRKRLGEILVEYGVVTESMIEEALAHGQEEGLRIGEALVALGLADEEDVTKFLAMQYDMEYVDLERQVLLPGLLEEVSEELIRRHLILPISKEGGRLKVIITDPLDLETMDMLRFRLNAEIDCALASKTRLRNFIERFVRSDISIDDTVHQLERDSLEEEVDVQEEMDAQSAPVIRLVHMLITEAVKGRSSDIHIEPMANRIRVRYRVDGVCRERDNLPKRMQGPVINRVKIMSGIDLAEKRLPTDGRIRMVVAGEDIDFRVSCLPGYHGESVVLRILRTESAKLGVSSLGFEQDDYERFNRLIKRPNGVFLVTGPTGSGKTTTLYAALNELNRPDRKIITAEDPVEYNFTGMNQVQVNEQIDLTFQRILRAMLRQAPNIILVGEIRDLEVAEVAVQAALTGHLVFSTLHTNDAPSAITRLLDMGVKPFLVASSIQAIMGQRLVRVICEECKEVDPSPDPRLLRTLGFTEEEATNGTIYHGTGCTACGGTGYRGRLGIFELMEMSHAVADLAIRRAPVSEIRQEAKAAGMTTLLEDGRRKILNGVTTPADLVRIAQVSELID